MPDAPVSWGELIDMLTILEIKAVRLADPAALANVRKRLEALQAVAQQATGGAALGELKAELAAVNQTLWDIEDAMREHERAGDFGPAFIALSRSIYRTNDRRAELKRQINALTGSDLVEEKSYADY